MAAIAVNVAANTNEPGFRGPIYPDGSFEYVPIPETEPTARPVPTYGDLGLETDVSDVADRPVHLDPEFAGYPHCERYTYGDPHGVKAGPLSNLSAGDYCLFYATLSTAGTGHPEWVAPEWGAYLIGHFRLARDPVTGAEYDDLAASERERFANNAHVKRDPFDAQVLLAGDPDGSRLYDTAVPLSSPDAGADPNERVTDLSADSGKGPWWRRPLRFDDTATDRLLAAVRDSTSW
ncbi:MAG: hypothetical protein ABEH35_08690 [Haloarculaceae archaeon]